MTRITTTYVLTPEIRQHYDRLLLMTPIELGDNLKKLHDIFLKIKKEAEKFAKYPKEHERWKNLEKKYWELYEQTKAKEERQGKETENRTKESFYYIRMPSRHHDRLFYGLRYGKTRTFYSDRRYNNIQKTKGVK